MSSAPPRLVLACCLLAVPLATRALAADKLVTDEQIATWTTQLEADEWAVRESATANLVKAGKAAIPVLEKAITTGGPETGMRVVTILGKQYQSKDEDTRKAAKGALERIAGQGNVLASSAKNALASSKGGGGATATGVVQIGGAGGVIQVGNGAVLRINGAQVQQLGGAGGAVTITVQAVVGVGGQQGTNVKVTNVNGVKDLTVTEGDKTTKIREQANGSIEVEITEKVEGKPKTTKYQAKNAAELKKQHPKIHELYAKHSGAAKSEAEK